MNSFRDMATAVRKRVFRKSVRQQTKDLDPGVRTALAEEIGQDEHGLETDLAQIEAELTHAKATLAEFQKKETFLGQRSRQYRLALDDRARRLAEEQRELQHQLKSNSDDDDDIEDNALTRQRQQVLEERMEKWEKDEDALTTIVETHKEILANCERIRRKIKELEKKQVECRQMSNENQDFLQAAISNDDEEGGGEDADGTDDEAGMGAVETEMSHLVTSSTPEEEETDDPPAQASSTSETQQDYSQVALDENLDDNAAKVQGTGEASPVLDLA
mmetsp:Transcript_8185/g.18385  ORF Transcript_8185/g.18385 Transcript_8185/m.18385 type:complete len:275 (-) Transcript_8185:118-942(-)